MVKMVTIKEAARETGLTYCCLRRWILSGEFTYFIKSGNRYLINLDRLIEFLNQASDERKHGGDV